MRNSLVIVVILILVAASVGAGYALGNSARSTQTLTSTSTQTVTSTSTSALLEPALSLLPDTQSISIDSNSSLGIALIVGLNATTLKQGQDLPNVVEVVNTLPRVNNVSVVSDYPVKPYQPNCDANPIDVEMYSGYYDLANISSASPLSYTRLCPFPFGNPLTQYQYYLFAPGSANATLYGLTENGTPANSGEFSLLEVNQTSVYQYMQSFLPDGAHPVLPVGVYTVAVQDFWDQIVISHFSVVS